MNITSLINITVRNLSVDQLVATRVDLKALAVGYSEVKLKTPDWIDLKIKEVEAEITSQTRALKLADLKKLQLRRQGLMTADEKRKALDEEIAALEALVG